MTPKQFINGRIVGGCSMHAEENPALCKPGGHAYRIVECGGYAGDDRDIIECVHCGKQKNVACNFDEDMS